MSVIRCVYQGTAPEFPATDQHPDAVRYGPLQIGEATVWIDAIGSEPSRAEVDAVLNPPAPAEPTPAEKLAAAGVSVPELKQLLGLS